MTDPTTDTVDVNGSPCRVWRKGSGSPLFYLPGFGGLPKWTPFLDRLAEGRTVVALSPPGFPGGLGHDRLDTLLDWIVATRDLLAAAGMEEGDLVASSVTGALALEVAALWPGMVRRLVLTAPFGLYDDAEPTADIWAQKPHEVATALCADPERWTWLKAAPEGANSVEWPIEQTRAAVAAARFLWPLGRTGVERRLHLVRCPTLLLWGSEDRILPFGYAARFEAAITGPVTIRRIAGAGHLAELDRPDEAAAAAAAFLA
ncbi:MAG: alpha/beta fold hydrolase [Alphaproteobacteria bacterium]